MNTHQSMSRRTLVRGGAWAVPTAAVATLAPAYATSPIECPPESYYAKSRIVATDPDYSNINYDAIVTLKDSPQGNFKMQHWVSRDGATAFWRLAVGAIRGAEPGATITIPIDPSWSYKSSSQLGVSERDGFNRFSTIVDASGQFIYTTSLPSARIDVSDTQITVTFDEQIEPRSAGMILITASPTVSAQEVLAGAVLTAEARMNYTPVDCTTVWPVPPEACEEDFSWSSTATITAERSWEITRDKHEPIGTGDCSDVSVDFWVDSVSKTDDEGRRIQGFSPRARVIVGTQFEARNVVATWESTPSSSGDTFKAVGLSGAPASPAGGATPDVYKVNRVDPLHPPVIESPTLVTWSLGTMPAQSSAQYVLEGETLWAMPGENPTEAFRQVVFTMSVSVTGVKDCGAAPVQCPPQP